MDYGADFSTAEIRGFGLPKQTPFSHWTVRYSVRFYKFVDNSENRICPDPEIIPSWDDYKSAREPMLDWVLNYRQ